MKPIKTNLIDCSVTYYCSAVKIIKHINANKHILNDMFLLGA